MSLLYSLEHGWSEVLCKSQPILAEMLSQRPEVQQQLGYVHTLREICQQPSTWLGTVELMQQSARELSPLVSSTASLILSGSGSSEFAGDCVRMVLQKELNINAQAIAGGTLLTHGRPSVSAGRPGLMVSIARSGDSPESAGAVALMLKTEPEFRHLVLTCNRHGRLANSFRGDSRVSVIALDDATNDRSLVMTSSFTNLILAARFLGLIGDPARYLSICTALSHAAATLLRQHLGTLAQAGKTPFRRVLYLGSGPRFAVAREAALKMLEMTAGRVPTSCETYLALRHGPMTAVSEDTLIVCFLASDPRVRAYEADVLRELSQKQLGRFRVIAGKDLPREVVGANDVAIPYQGTSGLGDDEMPVARPQMQQCHQHQPYLHVQLR